MDQARADALIDLLLTNVTVTATVTLGIPVLTGPDAHTARDTAIAEYTGREPAPTQPRHHQGLRPADAARHHGLQPPPLTSTTRTGCGRPIATGGLGLGRSSHCPRP